MHASEQLIFAGEFLLQRQYRRLPVEQRHKQVELKRCLWCLVISMAAFRLVVGGYSLTDRHSTQQATIANTQCRRCKRHVCVDSGFSASSMWRTGVGVSAEFHRNWTSIVTSFTLSPSMHWSPSTRRRFMNHIIILIIISLVHNFQGLRHWKKQVIL